VSRNRPTCETSWLLPVSSKKACNSLSEIRLNENRTTALIVDDEPSIRLSLRTILTGLGFTFVEAARGEEGVALVRTTRLDVVLLDINMPGLGGIELSRLIRKITPFPPL
jgi:CheY-like chemotaxis protein